MAPCGLVTSGEAQTAVGAPVEAPKVMSLPPVKGLALETCMYLGANGTGYVLVGLYDYDGDVTSTLFAQFRQSEFQDQDTTTVNGVADEAFEIGGASNSRLIFRKGSKAAEVSLATADTNLETRLLELGRLAAGRL